MLTIPHAYTNIYFACSGIYANRPRVDQLANFLRDFLPVLGLLAIIGKDVVVCLSMAFLLIVWSLLLSTLGLGVFTSHLFKNGLSDMEVWSRMSCSWVWGMNSLFGGVCAWLDPGQNKTNEEKIIGVEKV